MTKDEIKQIPIKSILLKYGFTVGRGGFCSCMLHQGDRSPSFKIFEDNNTWHCFGCGKGGDAITWVMEYFNVDFKTAFEELGGTYEQPRTVAEYRTQQKRIKEAEARAKAIEAHNLWLGEQRKLIGKEIEIIRRARDRWEAGSDAWIRLDIQIYLLSRALIELAGGGEKESGWREYIQLAGLSGYLDLGEEPAA